MNLDAVSEEIRTALGTITGLRRPPWGVETVQPPAALVTLPDQIDYSGTYGRNVDQYKNLQVVVLVGNPTSRGARKQLAPYVAGTGAKSVVATLEGRTWTTCHNVTVDTCEFDLAKYGGVDYLAAIFHLSITGGA